MPYQVQQIIEGKGTPICVTRNDSVSDALTLMIEHDFSQLPVTKKEDIFDIPEGMITYEGILRGVRNFNAQIDDLKVRDVMVTAPIHRIEDDMFDILDRLKDTNAVLIIQEIDIFPALVGIVTSYDATEYFRKRTEDLMRVEDIELMIKEFIKIAYTNDNDELDESRLNEVSAKIAAYSNKENVSVEKIKSFSDLTLTEYISMLLMKESWSTYEKIFNVKKDFLRELLFRVRDIRNALAHFRGDITTDQRDRLKFCTEWLARRQEEYQAWKEEQEHNKLIELAKQARSIEQPHITVQPDEMKSLSSISSTDFSVIESDAGGGRYAALADWLQSQPGKVEQVQLSFNQIEEIIKADLPASARNHRAWWANDSVGHTHSQLWLDAGWRTTYINLSEGKITFSRIREREKAYITFFSKLLDEVRKKASSPIRDVSPDGASWMVLYTIPRGASTNGSFSFSFTRTKKLRVELYLDLGDQEETKSVFDKLLVEKAKFESELGPVEWERLDNRRASRIGIYHDGQILDGRNHPELRKWAAETMVKFYDVIVGPAEQAILQVKSR
jgi:CBS domain-containing protein